MFVISVTGSRILARSPALASPCAALSGPITVTNSLNGDFATSGPTQNFTYFPVIPLITGVTSSASPITLGSPISISVLNPGVGPFGNAGVSFTFGGVGISASPNPITVGTGTTAFTSSIPTTGLTFPTQACTVGALNGTQNNPLQATVVFTNLTTGCNATAPNAITVQPPGGVVCVVPPTAAVTSPPPTCPTPNLSPASVVATHTATITITNAAGASTLTLSAPVVTATNATVTVVPNAATTVPGGGTTSYTVTVDPTAAGADGGTITFTTNDPTKQTITITVCGSAT
jgi:hypothetical protein